MRHRPGLCFVRAGRSAAWLARLLWEQEAAGSNPAAPTIERKDLRVGQSRAAGDVQAQIPADATRLATQRGYLSRADRASRTWRRKAARDRLRAKRFSIQPASRRRATVWDRSRHRRIDAERFGPFSSSRARRTSSLRRWIVRRRVLRMGTRA